VTYNKMTAGQMSDYVKTMHTSIKRLLKERERILQEIKDMQQRKEILSWNEIASTVAYPKAMPDQERAAGGNPDSFKLLHQAERINKIYISQMEELFDELEIIETEITKHKYVSRCISKLEKEDRDIIERFVCNDMTYERGAEMFHTSRSSFYRQLKRALGTLTTIYNS